MNRCVILLIRVYQVFLSQILTSLLMTFFGFQFTCKSSSTCSEYTIHQVEKHGTIIGLKQGLTRILACH